MSNIRYVPTDLLEQCNNKVVLDQLANLSYEEDTHAGWKIFMEAFQYGIEASRGVTNKVKEQLTEGHRHSFYEELGVNGPTGYKFIREFQDISPQERLEYQRKIISKAGGLGWDEETFFKNGFLNALELFTTFTGRLSSFEEGLNELQDLHDSMTDELDSAFKENGELKGPWIPTYFLTDRDSLRSGILPLVAGYSANEWSQFQEGMTKVGNKFTTLDNNQEIEEWRSSGLNLQDPKTKDLDPQTLGENFAHKVLADQVLPSELGTGDQELLLGEVARILKDGTTGDYLNTVWQRDEFLPDEVDSLASDIALAFEGVRPGAPMIIEDEGGIHNMGVGYLNELVATQKVHSKLGPIDEAIKEGIELNRELNSEGEDKRPGRIVRA